MSLLNLHKLLLCICVSDFSLLTVSWGLSHPDMLAWIHSGKRQLKQELEKAASSSFNRKLGASLSGVSGIILPHWYVCG